MELQMPYILISVLFGIVIGWIISDYAIKRRIAAEKRARQARKKARQLKILDHFRIEVKNNTIRLKKELRRLGISRQLAPVVLLFKNYKKRLHRVEDKELLGVLQNYYQELFSLLSAVETLINFTEKNIKPNEQLQDEIIVQFYNSMTVMTVQKIENIVETGRLIIGILEDHISEG